MAEKNTYDESKIKTLSSLEHIRLRTGMYIGRLGNQKYHDKPSQVFLDRIAHYQVSPPPQDWKGVFVMNVK